MYLVAPSTEVVKSTKQRCWVWSACRRTLALTVIGTNGCSKFSTLLMWSPSLQCCSGRCFSPHSWHGDGFWLGPHRHRPSRNRFLGRMVALKFLLGAFEAAYGYASTFSISKIYVPRVITNTRPVHSYQARHHATPVILLHPERDWFGCGIFVSAAPLASTFVSALGYGMTRGHSHLANWRLLLLEVCPLLSWRLSHSSSSRTLQRRPSS